MNSVPHLNRQGNNFSLTTPTLSRQGTKSGFRVEDVRGSAVRVEAPHKPTSSPYRIEKKRSPDVVAHLGQGTPSAFGLACTPLEPTDAEPASRVGGAIDQAVIGRYHLPQAWASFIDTFAWTWYVDLTFRDFPHPERADKGFMRFIHRLNRDAFGVKYWKDKRKGVTWARATEKQERGCDHYHAFIGNVPSFIERMHYFEDWRSEEGHCKFRVYDKTLGASFYMAKHTYAWKDGQIDLSGNLRYALDGSLVKAGDVEQGNIDGYRFLRPVKRDLLHVVA